MKPCIRVAEEATLEALTTGLEIALLSWEAQTVMLHRLLGLWGLLALNADEARLMVAEKPPAFAAALIAASATAIGGQRPDRVVAAAIHPLRSRTRANVARLGNHSIAAAPHSPDR